METKVLNLSTVGSLYDAISSSGGHGTISGLLTRELEWWFHGPQNCHHMMKMLTGKSSPSDFKFDPRSIEAVDGDRVIAEGWEGDQVYWVHVWTLKDGVITQFREYFNTWLTVAEFGNCVVSSAATLWQSHPRDVANRSLPGLMLAI